MRRVEAGAGCPGLYVVALAANPANLFDIFSADLLMQDALRRSCPPIVGLAMGKARATDLALSIAMDAYRQNGDFDMSRYLKGRVPDGEWTDASPAMRRKKRGRFGF